MKTGKNSIKVVIVAVFAVALVAVSIFILKYRDNSREITVTYDKTVAYVEVWNINSKQPSLVKKLTVSPDTLNIHKNGSYELRYKGTTGYADGVMLVSDKSSYTIKSDYSASRYAAMFTSEKAAINQTIQSIDPTINSEYTINNGSYYNEGKWYVTTLTSTQEPQRYFDTFFVLLARDGSNWKVVVPPSLVANYKQYSSIPKDIINYANTYRVNESLQEMSARTIN